MVFNVIYFLNGFNYNYSRKSYCNDVCCYFKKKVGYIENDFLLLIFLFEYLYKLLCFVYCNV